MYTNKCIIINKKIKQMHNLYIIFIVINILMLLHSNFIIK